MTSDPRYLRQAMLPFVGDEGQRALARGRAVIVGVGALGCASADLLVRAGVGRLSLIDRDVVELGNLQRQRLFTEEDAREGAPKAEAARRRLAAVNSSIVIEAVIADLTWRNAERLLGEAGMADDAPRGLKPAALSGASVIVDGTDNYETRYLLNDYAVRTGTAYVYGGVVAAEGMAMCVAPGRACLRCVFPEAPRLEERRTCETSGVFGPAVDMVAAMQASDALKVLMGRADLVAPALTRFDLERGEFRRVDLSRARDAGCPCCARRDFAFSEGRAGMAEGARLCGRNAVQIPAPAPAALSPGDASAARGIDLGLIEARFRAAGASVTPSPFMVRAQVDEALEITVFADGRAVVSGTTDPAKARAAHAKFVGA